MHLYVSQIELGTNGDEFGDWWSRALSYINSLIYYPVSKSISYKGKRFKSELLGEERQSSFYECWSNLGRILSKRGEGVIGKRVPFRKISQQHQHQHQHQRHSSPQCPSIATSGSSSERNSPLFLISSFCCTSHRHCTELVFLNPPQYSINILVRR
ncbi:hypothetical protein BGZ60DRAFT_266310 [Tricladium varicosporioides]|nr:hypothetical protein BGZ60DRAFT_266310 [Hymenoscyphus varicosporioides]